MFTSSCDRLHTMLNKLQTAAARFSYAPLLSKKQTKRLATIAANARRRYPRGASPPPRLRLPSRPCLPRFVFFVLFVVVVIVCFFSDPGGGLHRVRPAERAPPRGARLSGRPSDGQAGPREHRRGGLPVPRAAVRRHRRREGEGHRARPSQARKNGENREGRGLLLPQNCGCVISGDEKMGIIYM